MYLVMAAGTERRKVLRGLTNSTPVCADIAPLVDQIPPDCDKAEVCALLNNAKAFATPLKPSWKQQEHM
jgi:hypothetical protein